jgi:hypothetical protein
VTAYGAGGGQEQEQEEAGLCKQGRGCLPTLELMGRAGWTACWLGGWVHAWHTVAVERLGRWPGAAAGACMPVQVGACPGVS